MNDWVFWSTEVPPVTGPTVIRQAE
jgi:hypothetical protein